MTSGAEVPFVDFGRSYLIGNGSSTAPSPEPVEQNDVRLQVESLVRLYDADASLTRTIYQCAACKAENTFDATGPGDLFKRPNYDFLPAACGSELLIFRRGLLAAESGYRSYYPYMPAFGDLRAHVGPARGVERLTDFRAVAEASSAGRPIIGRTVLSDSGTGLCAELEYPIKTISTSATARTCTSSTPAQCCSRISACAGRSGRTTCRWRSWRMRPARTATRTS